MSGFVKQLTTVIEFGAHAEGEQVLTTTRSLPAVLTYKGHKLPAPLVPGELIDPAVVTGGWKRLVFGHPAREDTSASDEDRYRILSEGRR